MKTMKAIVKASQQLGGLELRDVPFPTPDDDQVLIKIKKTAICGTDIHIFNWDAWAQKTIKTPQIIGHEFVGEVVAVGRLVSTVKVGQIVSGEGHLVCGYCRNCISGFPHLCCHTVGIGVNMDGVFSEYIAFPASNVWVCDPSIPLDVLSIQDPLGNAVHTALSFPVLGEDVLVTGAGPIGLMSVPILRRAGARYIVVTDINPERLKLAKELGADATVDVRSQTIQEVVAKFPLIREGFDVGLEMSGSASAFSDMVEAMANGGNIAILGILPQDQQVNWNKVIFSSLTLRGIYGRQMYDTWYKMTALLQTGLDKDVAKVITHNFDYTNFQEAFELMAAGKSGKVILDWSE
ncbi:MAG: L-threonine 3-dehydrogenase [Defluviitaleaceae bacterium]|nr:L-threonine 3-dehydrogenase [Defluviitaleaceae bacterium]